MAEKRSSWGSSPKFKRICVNCSKRFNSFQPNSKYCTTKCSQKFNRIKSK